MIEFSERDTQIILEGLKLFQQYNENPIYKKREVQELIQRIESNNEDRHIRNIWRAMLDRCRNPNNKFYNKYGGRGISVCEEWTHLSTFKKWCYDNGYKYKLTIDRIDNDKDYCPENCRIATQKTQQRNRRNNRMFTDPFDGEELCLASIAEKYGMSIQTLSSRINIQKLSIEEALTKPFRKQREYASSELKPLKISERMMVWHDANLNIGEEYTLEKIAIGIGAQIESVKSAASPSRNKELSEYLLSELSSKNIRGNERVYIKTKNWLESD